MYEYVVIDGFQYAVTSGSYIRKWLRSFTSELAANIVRVNFVDRGPGLLIYSMTLQLNTWAVGSPLYNAGITQTAEQQMANLEASYLKVATALNFLDAFGNPPSASTGVFFTNLNQIIPNYSTDEKVYILAEIELTEASGIVV